MRLVKLQISNFCFRFPFKHPDAIKQIEPSSKTAYAAPYQGLPVSHITWEGCCLHKQKKLTPSLLGFTSNFAGDCTYSRCYCIPMYTSSAQEYCTSTKPTERTPRPRPNVAMLGRVPPKGLIYIYVSIYIDASWPVIIPFTRIMQLYFCSFRGYVSSLISA